MEGDKKSLQDTAYQSSANLLIDSILSICCESSTLLGKRTQNRSEWKPDMQSLVSWVLYCFEREHTSNKQEHHISTW